MAVKKSILWIDEAYNNGMNNVLTHNSTYLEKKNEKYRFASLFHSFNEMPSFLALSRHRLPPNMKTTIFSQSLKTNTPTHVNGSACWRSMHGTWRWISLESGDCSNSFKLSTHKFVSYARLISSRQILNLFFLFRSHFPRLTITLFLRSSLVTSALSCPDSRNYSSFEYEQQFFVQFFPSAFSMRELST